MNPQVFTINNYFNKKKKKRFCQVFLFFIVYTSTDQILTIDCFE